MKLQLDYFLKIVLPILVLGVAGVTLMVSQGLYIYLIATFAFWVLLSGLGIAVGFHRIYSHQCYNLKPWLDNFILVCGTLACQLSSLTWVAVHIGYHHPHADKAKDPHSPTKGFLHAFLGWTFTHDPKTINHKYAVKLLRKPFHVFCHKHYFKIIWGSVAIMFLILGWKITLIGYGIAASISILQDNLINVFGHWPAMGYRNFYTEDQSSNFIPMGYFAWGQGWHNNHHRFPGRFDFGVEWWEWDPCKIFIPLLKFGSAKAKYTKGKEHKSC